MAVNRERVALLVEALESGEYEQDRYALNHKGRFCCLGVACEVAVKNGLDIPVSLDSPMRGVAYDGESSVLPQAVAAWYGFEPQPGSPVGWESNPVINPMFRNSARSRVTAITANDTYGLGFPVIADGFRAEYLADAG
jgi:hypothetical protein